MNTRTCVHHELCVIRTVQIINPNNTRGTGGHLQISVIIFFISVQMILKWPAELLKFQNKGQELIDSLFGPTIISNFQKNLYFLHYLPIT